MSNIDRIISTQSRSLYMQRYQVTFYRSAMQSIKTKSDNATVPLKNTYIVSNPIFLVLRDTFGDPGNIANFLLEISL